MATTSSRSRAPTSRTGPVGNGPTKCWTTVLPRPPHQGRHGWGRQLDADIRLGGAHVGLKAGGDPSRLPEQAAASEQRVGLERHAGLANISVAGPRHDEDWVAQKDWARARCFASTACSLMASTSALTVPPTSRDLFRPHAFDGESNADPKNGVLE